MRSPQYASLAWRVARQSRETNSRMPRVITRSLYRARGLAPWLTRGISHGAGRRARASWTQKDLADRLGLDEQKIQDYEATDYQRASLARVTAIVRALGIEIREEVKL